MFAAGDRDYIEKWNDLVTGARAFGAAILVGTGVTLSAWNVADAGEGVVQVGGRMAIVQQTTGANTFHGYIAQNAYLDGTTWKYVATDAAALYGLNDDGHHVWYGVASGTAGATISWTERMRLTSTGLEVSAGGLTLDRSVSEPFLLFEVTNAPVGQLRGISGGGLRITNGDSSIEWARFTAVSNAARLYFGGSTPYGLGMFTVLSHDATVGMFANSAYGGGAVALGQYDGASTFTTRMFIPSADAGISVNPQSKLGAPANGIYGAAGTLVVLFHGTAGTKPAAIGTNTNEVWYHAPNAADRHAFYVNSTLNAYIAAAGLYVGNLTGAAVANYVNYYSTDLSAGNTIPSFYCEGGGVVGAGVTSTTVTHKIAFRVNGTVYYALATTNGT